MQIVKGIDVSYYDEELDWKLYNADFTFIKCSEGLVIDKTFRNQWRAAKGHTIRGAYHFFRAFIDPIKAAERLAEYLDGDLGELPPAIDLETSDGMPDVISRCLQFSERFRNLTLKRPMIYSSPGFLSSYHADWYADLEDYSLWLATYPFDKIYPTWTELQRKQRLQDIWEGRFLLSFPAPPKPFKHVSFLQFTGKGDPSLVDGYQGVKEAVDMNLYNGIDLQDLKQEFQINYIPKPEGETMPPVIYAKIKSFTNIRNGPYDSYPDIGDLVVGSTIEAVDTTIDVIGRKWYRLSKATNPQGGDIVTTLGKLVSDVVAWCYAGNAEEYIPTPTTTKVPFSIQVEGFRPYSGELEKL